MSSAEKTLQGSCLCGAVALVAEQVETDIHSCHCSMCRTWSGGPLLAASVGGVSFSGEENITRYRSSEWAERGFCNRCGTNLYYWLESADHYVISTGVFKDADQFHLSGEIFIDEKPSTYSFTGDHPRLTGEQFMQAMQSGNL